MFDRFYYDDDIEAAKKQAIQDSRTEYAWVLSSAVDYSSFDLRWVPNRFEADQCHAWGSHNNPNSHTTWLLPVDVLRNGNAATNFHDAVLPSNGKSSWQWITDDRIDYKDFNFDWLPDSWDDHCVHAFAMKNTEQLCYTFLSKGDMARPIKYHESSLTFIDPIPQITIEEYDSYDASEWVWVTDPRIDYTGFDFAWLPDDWDKHLTHCFTMQGSKQLSFTKLANTKYRGHPKFHASDLRFKQNTSKFVHWPDFVSTMLSGFDWQDSLANWVLEQNLSSEWVWITDKRIDYAGFDFTWLPDPWDHEYVHCFAMANHTQLSYTWLVNTSTLRDKKFKYHSSDLRFSSQHTELVLLDMGDARTPGMIPDKKMRFTGKMVDVLRNAIKRCEQEWLWVASSCSNYENFKFDWLPDLDQVHYAHCWPTTDQIKGDTFLMHVPTFLRTNEFEWNFDHVSIPRYPWPGIIYDQDNLADAIKQNPRYPSLYTAYYKKESKIYFFPTPCLWEDRPVVGMNKCNSASLVPRDCIVDKELYEYPHLERKINAADSCRIDFVFLDNGEADAKTNWDRLFHRAYVMPSKVSNVTPRLKAYKTAASKSDHDWFLAVFAKCWMSDKFATFDWRPDYWQQAKHYIFYNHNKDLDLTYGHMAPIAYNKRLMLENTGGLDMTLAQEHAVVPLVISETHLTDPWDIWRTAFRETAKLLYYSKDSNNIELEYRLNKWLDAEQHWYKRGAIDARDYFEATDGEYAWLMLTSEWDWLRKRFDALYSADLTT